MSNLDHFAKKTALILYPLREKGLLKYKWEKGCGKPESWENELVKETYRKCTSLSEGERLIEFRNKFERLWNDADDRKKFAYVEWIVKEWGKIRNIKCDTLKTYVELLKRENPAAVEPIKLTPASYSKCLAFLFPDEYYIYDSRVALAVSVITYVTELANEGTFQKAAAKSEATNKIAKSVEIDEEVEPVQKLEESIKCINYADYCSLVRGLATATLPDFNPQLVEQDLFMLGGYIRDQLKEQIAKWPKVDQETQLPPEFLMELKTKLKGILQLR